MRASKRQYPTVYKLLSNVNQAGCVCQVRLLLQLKVLEAHTDLTYFSLAARPSCVCRLQYKIIRSEGQLPVYLSSAVTSFLSPPGFQLPGYPSSAVTSFFSPQGFQLPTFRTGWCSSAVILFNSLSSGVSVAILSRSRVLFHCEVACLSLAV